MLDRIKTHLLDLFAADSRLLQGGSAYNPSPGSAAWSGVKRPANGDTATAGWINLFDGSYEESSISHRPAIYLGTNNLQASDKEDFPSISAASARTEFRVALIPLIVVVSVAGGSKVVAGKARDQLRFNMKQILLSNVIAAGYWYELRVPGLSGGGMAIDKIWGTSSGGNTQGVAEASGAIPVQVRYTWNKFSQA